MPPKGYAKSVDTALQRVMKEAERGLKTKVAYKLENIVRDNAISYGVGTTIPDKVHTDIYKSSISVGVPLNTGHESLYGSDKLGIEMGGPAIGLPYWIDQGRVPILSTLFTRRILNTDDYVMYHEPKPFWTKSVKEIKQKSVPKTELASYLKSKGFKVVK